MNPSRENCKKVADLVADFLALLTTATSPDMPPEVRKACQQLRYEMERSPKVKFIMDFLREAGKILPPEEIFEMGRPAGVGVPVDLPGLGKMIPIDLAKLGREMKIGPPPTPRLRKSVVTCPWCKDPMNPQPEFHPGGQVEHVLPKEEK